MTRRVHLELLPKPRLIALIHAAEARADQAAAEAEAWREYADRVAATATTDRQVANVLRTLIRSTRARVTRRAA